MMLTLKNNFMSLRFLLPILLLCSSSVALSQDAESDEPFMEEVIINGDRRAVNYQDFGGTAVMFTGDDLKLLGTQNITDLAESVPGLEIGNKQGNVEVWIRGIGSSNNTELGDPAAAFHFDDIYVPRPSGVGSAFFDIETVEVNVGPQGTIRGRNATAGSLNVKPIHPGYDITDVWVNAEYGTYEQRVFEGGINTPGLTDNSGFRLSYFRQVSDSYYNDVSGFDIGMPEAQDNTGLRLQYKADLTDSFMAHIQFNYNEEKGTGYTGTNYANPLGNDIDPESIRDPRDVYARGFEPKQDTVNKGYKFHFRNDFDSFSAEYIFGIRDLVYDYAATTPLSPDYPGILVNLTAGGSGPADDLPASVSDRPLGEDVIPLFEAVDNFSQYRFITDSVARTHEFRVFTPEENDFFFSAGLFYFTEEQRTFLGTTGDRSGFFQGVEFNQFTDTESISVYGDATWRVRDDTRLTAGVRWTDDHKDRNGINAQFGFLLFGFDTTQPAADAFNCCVGVRVGTEGFEFGGFNRQYYSADIDGNGGITKDEYIQFYLDGIQSFGARDTIDEILYAMLDDKSIFQNDPKFAQLETLYPSLGQVPCRDYDTGDDIICNEDGFYDEARSRIAALLPDGTTTTIVPQRGEIDVSFTDWRIRLEHDIDDDHLVYGLVASGHKSGGFNDTFRDSEAFTVTPTYGTEEVLLYELGTKNEFEFFDIPTRLNASLFYNDYQNQVFCTVLSVDQAEDLANTNTFDSAQPADASLGVNFCFNAADSAIYGSQFEGQFDFPYEITLKWTALWLEAEVQNSRLIPDSRFRSDGPNGGQDAVLRSINGNRLPFTPKFQLNLALSQSIDLPTGTLDYLLSAGWRDEQFLTIYNSIDYRFPETPRERLNDRVEAYWNFDFGMGYSHGDTNLRVEAFINNIFNDVRPAAIIITQDDNTRFFTRPRTYGVRAIWRL